MNRKLGGFVFPGLLLFLGLHGCSSEEYTSAKLYIQQQNWEKAEEFLLKAMVVEPDNPEIPYLAGREIYARRQNWEKMNAMFAKAMALDSNKVILQGHSVKTYVENTRNQHWVAAFNTAVNLYKQSQTLDGEERGEALRQALDKFKVSESIDPNQPQNYASEATCHIELGDQEQAQLTIKKAADLAPQEASVLITAGQIFSRSGDHKQAVAYFEKALKIDPRNKTGIRLLASSYYDTGDRDLAIVTYERAIREETDPKIKADLYFNLGVLYMQIKDYSLAEENFLTALDLNPSDIEAIVGMAQTFESAEEWSKAERFYRQLTELQPSDPVHLRGLARVLYRQGNLEDAEYYLEKAKQLEP